MSSVSDLPHSTTKSFTNSEEITSRNNHSVCQGLALEVKTFSSVALLLISFIGILANSLIIVSYAISRKLRSKTNALVINLAFTDGCACLCLPVVAVFLLIQTDDGFGSENISPVIVIGLVNMCIECGVLTVTLIAINRFILVTKTHRTFHKMFRTKMLRIWYGILWLVSFSVAAIPIFAGIGKFGVFKNLEYDACERNEEDKPSHIYNVVFVMLLIPTPLAVSFYCYICIYKYIRKHNKQLHHRRRVTTTTTPVNELTSASASRFDVTETTQAASSFSHTNPVDVTQSLFWTVLGSVIFLTPHVTAQIVNASDAVILHTSVFLSISCCTNPLLYGLSQPMFKNVFKSILFCRCKEIPEPTLKCLQAVHHKNPDLPQMSRRERPTTVVREGSFNRKTLSILEQRANMINQ